MDEIKVYKCQCDEPGFIKIDSTNTSLVCGVRGVIDQGNIRLTNGVATCVFCNNIIYEDK